MTDTAHPQTVGALVIGGDHPGLAIARSLGRRNIPVYVIDDQLAISKYSRYATRVVRVKDLRDPQKTVESVLEIATKPCRNTVEAGDQLRALRSQVRSRAAQRGPFSCESGGTWSRSSRCSSPGER